MNQTTKELIKQLGRILKKNKCKLVTAESCTGGGVGYYITSLSGSSQWFDRGFITYSNKAKADLLNVSLHTLLTFGAVSEETAAEMAKGALKNSEAEVSIAITGIAGPEGGTPQKPIGTVWFGYAFKNPFLNQTKKHVFEGTRNQIRKKAIETALKEVLQLIEQNLSNSLPGPDANQRPYD